MESCVADTGLREWPEQVLGRFQPYNRRGRESSGVGGIGLGPTISRQADDWMGGAQQVRSRLGEVPNFTLHPPCVPGGDDVPGN
jgi:hypothetical protein